MKSQTSKIETTLNQEFPGKEIPIALPIGTEARQSLSFPGRILLAVLALFTAFGLGMASRLNAAEPSAAPQDALLTKEYAGSPDLIASLRKASPSNPSAPLSEVFESLGVPFPQGTWVQILPGGRVIVRNTKENMELVDALIEAHSGKAGGSH